MGLFGGKTIITVNSSVIDMAEGDSSKWLPTALVEGSISGDINTEGYIINTLLKDRAVCFKRYYRWARTSGYSDHVGLGSSVWYPGKVVDQTLLTTVLTSRDGLSSDQSLQISSVSVDFYNAISFADFWVYKNRPSDVGTKYTVEYYSTLIGTTEKYGKYYNSYTDEWTTGYYTVNEYRQDIQITFIDGSSVILDTSAYNQTAQYLYCTYVVTTTTYTSQTVNGTTTQVPTTSSETRILIYQYQSGDASLDSFFIAGEPQEKTYFPFIPLRHEKNWYSESYEPETFAWIKKAYRKINNSSTNQAYNTLIDTLDENDSIDDVNFTYVNLGIPINTEYQEGKKYLFTFFKDLYLNEALTEDTAGKVGTDPSISDSEFQELHKSFYGSDRYDHMDWYLKTVYIKSDYGIAAYNTQIKYLPAVYGTAPGQAVVGLKKGQYAVFSKNVSYTTKYFTEYGYEGQHDNSGWVTVDHTCYRITFAHQISDDQYEAIILFACNYYNYIYAGRSVSYSAHSEIQETDASGFIVPLQWQTFNKVGLSTATDLANKSLILVFNTYQIRKQKWYQSGLFKVVTFIIAVICAWFTGGSSLAAYSALYAAAYCVAYAAISMFIISKLVLPLLVKMFTAVFGQTVGNILATVAVVVISFICMNFNNLAGAFSNLINSVAGTMAMAFNTSMQAVSQIANAKATTYANKLTELAENTQQAIDQISQMWDDLLNGNSLIDMSAINYASYKAYFELPSSFLQRTLLTGSEICDINLSGISNMSKITLNTSVI